MGYLYALAFLALLFALLHYFTELNGKQKALVIFFLATAILGAYLYNIYANKEQERILQIVRDFQNGKNLTCKGKDVNSSFYTLSVGTYTFIGKENTSANADMVSVSSCQ